MMPLTKENFDFLVQLKNNNNRDWFTEHKSDYEREHGLMIDFADQLLAKLNTHDTIETASGKKSLYRIYRDVRFSKDKSPYKAHWSGGFKRATNYLRGGYYFHIEPGNKSFVGGGFWAPNKEDLQRIREAIAMDHTEMEELINAVDFVKTFGTLQGEQLKSAPKGFDKEHPGIDLLRYKQFILVRNFTDAEVLKNDFSDTIDTTFKKMRPFFDYMSDVLTTDGNGSPLF